MAGLFDATTIGSLRLKNRFVRSATWEGLATKAGFSTSRLTEVMVELARGEVGLIISGHAYVSPEGQAGPWQLGIYGDDLIPKLKQMTSAVHTEGGKIVLQLAHAGLRAPSSLTGVAPMGPSARSVGDTEECREMTRQDIQGIVTSFSKGAKRAQESGFDAVQIHAAHGYLLSQFLSPFYNHRRDEYGGDLENRARLVLEIVLAVRNLVGETFPVMIKMNSEDFLENGLSVEEMLQVVGSLQRAGIDAIELSGGTGDSGKYVPVRLGKIGSPEKEAYYREAARRYKESVQVPLILVGGIRSYDVACRLVETGLTDYVAFSRPLIREPHLVKRWKSGDTRKAECLSDNLCFKPVRRGEGIYCYAERLLEARRSSQE